MLKAKFLKQEKLKIYLNGHQSHPEIVTRLFRHETI